MTTRVMAWAERAPLWRVFWLYGVIPSNLLWAAALGMMFAGLHINLVRSLLVFLLVFTAWIVRAVWLAAPNVGDRRYGLVSRALTVAWGINTVLLVFFLELQLLH
ncbi:MAG TPA: hypothetical protein VMV99_12475 [Rhodanobacter sp.]|nr:hypothetical protein [Rhodanobacter sp.]